MKTHFLTFSLLVLLHCTATTTTLAQSPAPAPSPPAPAPPVPALAPPAPALAPPAPAPAPSGPTNVTKILEKAGQFTTLIRLLKTTQVDGRLEAQLNISQGLTIFAPADDAFSSLKPGTLNSLTDEQQVQLVLFHIIPSFLPASQFQTLTNPIRTQAGDNGQYPLNVTTSGNQANVSTGIVEANVTRTIYSDNQLAVYQVDKVLLPWAIFGPHPPAPAPAPSKKPKKKSVPVADDSTATPVASAAAGLSMRGLLVGLTVVVIGFFTFPCNS